MKILKISFLIACSTMLSGRFMIAADVFAQGPKAPAAASSVGKEIQIEFNGQWFPGKIADEKENAGLKYYQVTYTASGGQEWVAPNRVLLDPKSAKPTVGELNKLPDTVAVGAVVSIEYNGGWYPGKLDEIGALSGVPIYKVTYTQSGLPEWVAANRLKVTP